MRVKIAIPEAHVTAPVLDAGLEAVTRLDEQMIAAGEVPSFERGLRYGVQWRPEPKGDEHFDSADRVLARRAGDCDDLAPWHAASLRVSGEDPGATAVVRRSGPKRWHAVVLRSDGSIDDPSLRAGMKAGVAPMSHGVMGAVLPYMLQSSAVVGGVGAYIVRPQIALRPVHDQIQARADLPWMHDMGQPSSHNLSMTALHRSPVAATALTGAINDVCDLALCSGVGRGDHIERLQCIADACQGASFQDLVHIYGEDHAEAASAVVGSLFGKLGRGLGKLARGAVSFVPGGGAALTALDTGRGLLHHKHHGAPPDQSSALAQPAASPGAAARPQRASVPGSSPGVAAVETSSGRPIHIHVH